MSSSEVHVSLKTKDSGAKLEIFKNEKNSYHFNTKDSYIGIEHKDRRLKFKLHKWDGEASVEAALCMVEADTHTFTENRVETEDAEKITRIYPIDIKDGGLRFEVVDKVKSPPYIRKISIACKNTRWSKQPPLTQEEKDRGRRRPDNVVNSFAVYHTAKKHNKYRTGKMFHWYRTKVIDAEGKWAWCDTDVDRYLDPTEVIITAPTEFMESAVYPVTWDPDIGYSDEGGSWNYIGFKMFTTPNYGRMGTAWTMPGNGTANWIKAYLRSTTTDVVDVKVFISEKDSGGENSHGQIAVAEKLACIAAAHWEEFTLNDEEIDNGVTYILNALGDARDVTSMEEYDIAYDSDGGVGSRESWAITGDNPYTSPQNPWTGAQIDSNDFSIYLNYTEGAVDPPTVTTQAATGLTVGAGTLHGTITATGGENANERGFDWDYDTGAPYAYEETDLGDFGVGAFSEVMSGFTEGNTVYFRGKANNSAGWGYGGEESFVVRKALVRTAAAAVGLVGTTGRQLTAERSASGAISVVGTSGRTTSLSRAAAGAMSVVGTAARMLTAIRSGVASMSMVGTTERTYTAVRAATGAISVAETAARSWVGNRAASASVSVVETAVRIVASIRSAAASIGLVGTADRDVNIVHSTPIDLEVIDTDTVLEVPDTAEDLEVPDTSEDLKIPDTSEDLEVPDEDITLVGEKEES